MAHQSPLWISEAEVVSIMDMPAAIDALENGLMAEARGDAQNMVKTHVAWEPGRTLHAIGAVFPRAGFAGTKTWVHTEQGATPLLVLFDSNNGELKSIIEAFALGQMRTGGISGIATRWLAQPQADEMTILGTGKQAMTQVAAVLAVRPVRRVRVFGRNEERRAQFISRVRQELGVEAVAAGSVTEAVEGALIITAATRATEPILSARMVIRGAHINAIGAILPTRAEIARDVLERCHRIVVDSVPQAQHLSRELIDFFGQDPTHWKEAWPLSTVVAARRPRADGDDLTLFKSLGMGISDLSLAIEIYQKALDRGLGRSIVHPERATPKLRAASH